MTIEMEIGASEAAAALGLDAYRTPLTLFREKAERKPREPESDAQRIGKEVEHAIARLFEGRTQSKLDAAETMHDLEDPWLRATPDRLLSARRMGPELREVLKADDDDEWFAWEAKTAGLVTARPVREVQMKWGAPMTDDVPRGYAVQVIVQIHVLNGYLRALDAGWCTRGILTALIAGLGDQDYVIAPSPEVVAGVVNSLRLFRENALNGIEPAPETADDWDAWLEARSRPYADSVVFSTPEIDRLVGQFAFCRRVEDVADTALKRARALLIEAIQSSGGSSVEGPWGRVAYTRGGSGPRLNPDEFSARLLSLADRMRTGQEDAPLESLDATVKRIATKCTRETQYGRQLRASFRDEETLIKQAAAVAARGESR